MPEVYAEEDDPRVVGRGVGLSELQRTAGARVEQRPGLRLDLDELDKQIGLVGQALTAFGKLLDPVLRPEGGVPVQGEESVAEAYRARGGVVERDVAGVAPLRERVGELSAGVRKVLGRLDELMARVEL